MVINKIDENPAFDVNRVFLQEKYKNIKGFFRVSCELQDKFDTEETLLKKADDFFMFQPNIMGIGVNVNKLPQLVKKLFKKKQE